VNRRFQAKLAKSKNVYIIKTTASIPTKFCTVMIKTIKYPSWVVPTHALQTKMALTAAILEKRKIATSRLRFERFRRNLARCSSTLLTVKIQDDGGRHLEKSVRADCGRGFSTVTAESIRHSATGVPLYIVVRQSIHLILIF